MQSSQTRTTTRRTVTSSEGGGLEIGQTYMPKTLSKSVVINRSSHGGGRNRGSMFGAGSSSYSGSHRASFNPAVYSQMAGTGINDFRDHREKEKREMQDCNERLATYIEKVRWLEAKNKQLEAENEALRKRKQEDWRPIRDMFESELQQAREVIKDLSTEKGVNEAKLAGLQDEIASLKDIIAQHEANAKDYANKIDRLNSQIGEYEGELNTLRNRCGSLEDEISKLRALIAKYKDENARLRADLDAETAAHIQQEVLAQTLQEEVDFLNELLEKLQVTQQEPIQVKGLDMENFFKSELKTAIADMQQMYDNKLDQMTMETEHKMQTQMNQLKSGNVRDTMEAEHSKSEVKRLRDQLSEKNARIAQLESELAAMRADRDNKAALLAEQETEFHRIRLDLERQLAEYQQQVELLMVQINELMDAKMSLELEIACYRKLLEGEENRSGLRQLVEQTIGVQSSGASSLANIIGQSSGSKGSSEQFSTMTSSMKMQKSHTGSIQINTCDPLGGTKIALKAEKPTDLNKLRLTQKVNGQEVNSFDLRKLGKQGTVTGDITLFGKSVKALATGPSDYVCDTIDIFRTGQAVYTLEDTSTGKEVASMKVVM